MLHLAVTCAEGFTDSDGVRRKAARMTWSSPRTDSAIRHCDTRSNQPQTVVQSPSATTIQSQCQSVSQGPGAHTSSSGCLDLLNCLRWCWIACSELSLVTSSLFRPILLSDFRIFGYCQNSTQLNSTQLVYELKFSSTSAE